MRLVTIKHHWRQTIRNEASNAVVTIADATTVDQVAAVFPVPWTPNPDTPVQVQE